MDIPARQDVRKQIRLLTLPTNQADPTPAQRELRMKWGCRQLFKIYSHARKKPTKTEGARQAMEALLQCREAGGIRGSG